MRTSISITLILLLALATFGWRNHHRITSLAETQRKLVANAQDLGHGSGFASDGKPTRITKRPRVDPVAEAKQAAARAISYGKEVDGLRERHHEGDAQVAMRVLEETEALMRLDDSQLRTLIDEVLASGDLGRFQKAEIVMFALNRMLLDHPKETLELITTHAQVTEQVKTRDGYPINVIFKATRLWALRDHTAALEWTKAHRENGSAVVGFVAACAEQDAPATLAAIEELGVPPKHFPGYFAGAMETPEQRCVMLQALRTWKARIGTAGTSEFAYDFDSAGSSVVFGQYYYLTRSVESATRCIESAGLTPDELAWITRSPRLRPGETSDWAKWLVRTLPEDLAKERIRSLLPTWRKAEPAVAEAFVKEHGID